jgi:hypothetical protein
VIKLVDLDNGVFWGGDDKDITISILRKKNERLPLKRLQVKLRSLLHQNCFVGAYADTTVYVDNIFTAI